MFGRATIRLGIGPHYSSFLDTGCELSEIRMEFLPLSGGVEESLDHNRPPEKATQKLGAQSEFWEARRIPVN